jgi:hypothetical protein
MPPLPAVDHVVRLTVFGDTPGYPWVNAFFWAYTGGPPAAADVATIADDLLTEWIGQFAPLMLTASHINGTTCVDLSSSSGASGEGLGINAGSRGTVELPGSSCVLIRKNIARRYRGGHPRSYVFAGIQTDLVDSAHWSNALVGDVQAAYTAVTAALNSIVVGATTLTHEVNVSYITNDPITHLPVRRVTPLVDPVIGHAAQSQVAIQRRRVGR